jgi:hypothetical protein
MKNVSILFLIILMLITLSGCFPRESGSPKESPAGFFMGVWHGWIAPISLIASLFSNNIRIYEVYNSGWWYDFGFYMAVIAGFGGLTLSRNTKKGDH